MEKNENEELLEQSPADIQQEDTQEIAKSGEEEPDTEEQKVSNGRFILWSLAGVYLLYTSYSLCKGYVTGEEGTSMGFMLAGIAFAAIGAGLLFFGIKNMLSESKSSEECGNGSCRRRRTEERGCIRAEQINEHC